MGKRSVKENKNLFQQAREACGLSREAASDLMGYVSESRIEKIESEKILPTPEDVLAMAQAYKKPSLNYHYCATICPIGQRTMHNVESKALSQIVLEILASLGGISKERDRLIEISVDGQIADDELRDFARIKNQLDDIAQTVASLQLWIDETIVANAEGADSLKRYSEEVDSANP
ncbi:MAG: helix-turn-helix transcriptional regulator [Peptococcaceae bacterium]|nr:helix-turn-helix transcriptional regulator [Peptococcaceae bacterium]